MSFCEGPLLGVWLEGLRAWSTFLAHRAWSDCANMSDSGWLAVSSRLKNKQMVLPRGCFKSRLLCLPSNPEKCVFFNDSGLTGCLGARDILQNYEDLTGRWPT